MSFESLATSTAMPVAAQALDGVRGYGLAFSLFLTLYLVGVVLAGSWGDARGPAGPVRAGLVCFAAGLVVCGLAGSFPVLLLGRAVSGVGGGLLIVSMYLVVARVFPPELQPRAFTFVSAGWVMPSIVGPSIAGWLAEHVSWRAVFLVVPPLIAVLSPVMLRQARPQPREPGQAPADRGRVLRGVALAVAVTALQWAMQGLGRAAPADRPAWLAGVLATGVGSLLLLPRLLPPGTLRLARGLPTVIVLRGMYSAAFFGAETFVPLMLVRERGLSPTQAGLALTGGAVGWAVGSWLQSRPWMPLPRHLLLAVGGLLMGLAVLGMTVITRAGVPAWPALPIWAVGGAGMGMAMASTSVLVLRLSDPDQQGRNSAALQIGDGFGSVLGIGGAGALFAALHDPTGSDLDVFRMIWLGLGVVGLLSFAVAFRARPRPA